MIRKLLSICAVAAALMCGSFGAYAQKNYPKLRPIRNAGQEGFYTLAQNKSGFWGYVNSEGKKVIPYVFHAADTFTGNGVARVKYDQWWGVVDLSGQYLLIPVNDAVIFPDRELPDCIITLNHAEDADLYSVYSHSGELLHEIKGSSLSLHQNAQFSLKQQDGSQLYFDGSGTRLNYREIKLYDDFKPGTDSLWTAFMPDGTRVLLDNRWIPVFDENIYMLDGDSFYVGKKLMSVVRNRVTSRLGMMNSDGEEIIACEYDRLYRAGNYVVAEVSTPRSARLFSPEGQQLFGPADELSFNGSFIYQVTRGKISISSHSGEEVAQDIDRNSFSGRFYDEAAGRFVLDRNWKAVDGHIDLLSPGDKESYPFVEDFLPLPLSPGTVAVKPAPRRRDPAYLGQHPSDSLIRFEGYHPLAAVQAFTGDKLLKMAGRDTSMLVMVRLDSTDIAVKNLVELPSGCSVVVCEGGWYCAPDSIDIEHPLLRYDDEDRLLWSLAPDEGCYSNFLETAWSLFLAGTDGSLLQYDLKDMSLVKKETGIGPVDINEAAKKEKHLLVRKASEFWGNRIFTCYVVEASDGRKVGLCHGMDSQKLFEGELGLEFGSGNLVISTGTSSVTLVVGQPDGVYEFLF